MFVSTIIPRQSALPRRALWLLNLFAVMAVSFFGSRQNISAQTNIQEFSITSSLTTVPIGITYSTSDHAYWFAEFYNSRLGRIDPNASNTISEVIFTNNQAEPYGILQGPAVNDTNIWFTEYGAAKIGRIAVNNTNVYSEYALANTNASPHELIVGPDGNFWTIEFNLDRIASFAPTVPLDLDSSNHVVFTHETTPIHTNGPYPGIPPYGVTGLGGLTVGSDNNIWFTEGTWGIIGRINLAGLGTNYSITSNNITEFHLATNAIPEGIVGGPDGALWFTEYNTNRIGRITTSGIITEYQVPTNYTFNVTQPYHIIKGHDNDLWFTQYGGSTIGRVTTNGIFTIFPTPTSGSFPIFLATGPDGTDTNIYFGENVGNSPGSVNDNIGVIRTAQALNLHAPTYLMIPSGPFQTNLMAVFQNSNTNNTVGIGWGDGSTNVLVITNGFATTNSFVTNGSLITTNVLSITCTVPINTNNASNVLNGTFVISATHYYAATNGIFQIQLTVTDTSNDMSTASISLVEGPQFLAGSAALGNGEGYLEFPDGVLFGYFNMNQFPYLLHRDLGFEYFQDAGDAQGDAYLYDITDGAWLYTGPALFPYLYDFALNSWVYYQPDNNRPGHYTSNPREFYAFSTPITGWTTSLTNMPTLLSP